MSIAESTAIINANRHEKLHALTGLIKGTPPSESRVKGASRNEVARRPRLRPGLIERG
jgi:hypothetical protein